MIGVKRFLIVGAAAAAAAIAIFHPAPRPADVITQSAQAAPSTPRAARLAASEQVVVYVAGAVRRPGLYRVRSGARANDALRLAGGFTRQADTESLNLAARVQDGDEIRAPKIGECLPSAARRPRSKHSRRKTSSNAPIANVNLNSADAAQLAALPGVGDTLAQRIIAYRVQNGPFASLDELADVSGFTQRRVDALTPYLTL